MHITKDKDKDRSDRFGYPEGNDDYLTFYDENGNALTPKLWLEAAKRKAAAQDATTAVPKLRPQLGDHDTNLSAVNESQKITCACQF